MKYPTLIITGFTLFLLPIMAGAAENGGLADGDILNTGYLIKLGAGLVAVIVLFIAMAWLMRNMGIGTVSRDGMEHLKIKATLSVGTRERIVLSRRVVNRCCSESLREISIPCMYCKTR